MYKIKLINLILYKIKFMDNGLVIKINYLLKYMSKVDLCELLQISRGNLYLKLKTNKWNTLHIIIIERIFLKIENIKDVYKIKISDNNLIIYYCEKTKLSKIIFSQY